MVERRSWPSAVSAKHFVAVPLIRKPRRIALVIVKDDQLGMSARFGENGFIERSPNIRLKVI